MAVTLRKCKGSTIRTLPTFPVALQQTGRCLHPCRIQVMGMTIGTLGNSQHRGAMLSLEKDPLSGPEMGGEPAPFQAAQE